ncbi:MAG TPA: hypothetical protein VG268_10275, partial [Streptosporangiaceae bacterium]|nr:hypothetical protein [Streptosporangiaceae bacterium]
GAVVPEQAGRPSVKSTDPVTGDPVANGTGSRDPLASDTTVQDDTATHDRATMDPDAPATDAKATDATGATDLRATRDPEVAPDTQVTGDTPATLGTDPGRDSAATDAAPGGEITPDAGFPAQNATATSQTAGTSETAEATSATDAADDPAAAAATTGTPVAPVTSAPAATGTPVPGAPGTGTGTTGVEAASAALVSNGAQLHDDWARIQSSFVDDPHGSVSQAADLLAQVTGSLVSAVQERERTLRSEWDGRSDSDTENLRNALRDYRAFFELLIKL